MKSDRSKRLAKMIREGKIKPASELSASTCDVPTDYAERRALANSFVEEVRAKAIAAGMAPEDFDAELARLQGVVVAKVRDERDRSRPD